VWYGWGLRGIVYEEENRIRKRCKNMKKKNRVGIIVIVAIVVVAMFAGCVDEKTTVEPTAPETGAPAAETPTTTATPTTIPLTTTPTITHTDRETLENLIIEHNKLFKETEEASKKGAKPHYTKDEHGNVVTRWNSHPNGAFDTVEKKRDDGHGWTTTAYRNGKPLITVYGKVGGDTLRDAYNEITGGVYGFTKNQANVAFIRLYVWQVEGLNISTLQRILANPTISTDDLADMVGKANNPGSGAHPAMVIGYTDTADPNDGNRIYASVRLRFSIGLPFKFYYFEDPTA